MLDSDLFIDTEPVIAGFAAANYLDSSFDGTTPSPDDVTAFLNELHDDARETPVTSAAVTRFARRQLPMP